MEYYIPPKSFHHRQDTFHPALAPSLPPFPLPGKINSEISGKLLRRGTLPWVVYGVKPWPQQLPFDPARSLGRVDRLLQHHRHMGIALSSNMCPKHHTNARRHLHHRVSFLGKSSLPLPHPRQQSLRHLGQPQARDAVVHEGGMGDRPRHLRS